MNGTHLSSGTGPVMHIKISEELDQRLTEHAQREQRRKADIVRMILDRNLPKLGGKKAAK